MAALGLAAWTVSNWRVRAAEADALEQSVKLLHANLQAEKQARAKADTARFAAEGALLAAKRALDERTAQRVRTIVKRIPANPLCDLPRAVVRDLNEARK